MTIHYNGFTFSEIHALGFNIAEVYHGSDLVWGAWKNILYNVSGDYSTYLPRGYYYQIKIHGAGGAGGTSGDVGSYGGAAGVGGAGGPGKMKIITVKQEYKKFMNVHVGAAGLIKADGGNGGNGGSGGSQWTGGAGGPGGGGGEPSYLVINENLIFAEGGAGGGGGGGGGTNHGQKSSRGAGGGGGGGYYHVSVESVVTRDITVYYCERSGEEWYKLSETPDGPSQFGSITITAQTPIQVGDVWRTTIPNSDILKLQVRSIDGGDVVFGGYLNGSEYIGFTPLSVSNLVTPQIVLESVPGQNGANQQARYGASGTAGNTTDFPDIKSGAGGAGYSNGSAGWINISGGAAASGGGASGASGGGWGDYSSGGSEGGGGGGGAAGDDIAGGGGSSYRGGQAASNHYTTPLSTENNLGETVSTGWGTGGTTNTNGSDGWIYIERIGRIIIPNVMDLGLLSTADPQSLDNAGAITGIVAESDDAGSITGTVSDTDDAGTIYTPVPATPWVLGSITDAVSETTNCGNIM